MRKNKEININKNNYTKNKIKKFFKKKKLRIGGFEKISGQVRMNGTQFL